MPKWLQKALSPPGFFFVLAIVAVCLMAYPVIHTIDSAAPNNDTMFTADNPGVVLDSETQATLTQAALCSTTCLPMATLSGPIAVSQTLDVFGTALLILLAMAGLYAVYSAPRSVRLNRAMRRLLTRLSTRMSSLTHLSAGRLQTATRQRRHIVRSWSLLWAFATLLGHNFRTRATNLITGRTDPHLRHGEFMTIVTLTTHAPGTTSGFDSTPVVSKDSSCDERSWHRLAVNVLVVLTTPLRTLKNVVNPAQGERSPATSWYTDTGSSWSAQGFAGLHQPILVTA